MTVDEIERAAMAAARLCQPNPPPDMLDCTLYLALYSLYATLYAGQLTREQARPIKTSILVQYRKQKDSYDFDMKLRRSAVDLWSNTELAGSTYAQERTLDNADRLWAAVLNLPEGSKPSGRRNQETD